MPHETCLVVRPDVLLLEENATAHPICQKARSGRSEGGRGGRGAETRTQGLYVLMLTLLLQYLKNCPVP